MKNTIKWIYKQIKRPFIAIGSSLKRLKYVLTIRHKERTIFLLIIAIHWIYGYAYITGSNFYVQYIEEARADNGESYKYTQEVKRNRESAATHRKETPEQLYQRAYEEDKGFRSYIENANIARNNFGNLEYQGQPNSVKEGRFAKFDTPYNGYRALIMQITADMNRGDTLEKFITEYAPPHENDTENYIQICEKKVGSRKQLLKDIDILNLSTAMVFAEHSVDY
jgi:hypothetical protein